MASSGPEPTVPLLESLLRRDRAITLTGIALLCLLAWLWLASGAGLGMSVDAMTGLSAFPHKAAMAGPMAMDGSAPPSWSGREWTLTTAMWAVMMVAMMTPAAAPAILLYARVHRHAAAGDGVQAKLAPTGAFFAGYLLVWSAFSVLATVLLWALERAGAVSTMGMASQSRWLSASVLLAVGVYQLTPLKRACLAHCRSPGSFLSRHWRPGPAGALRLGVLHGAWCLGCCWALMLLLFVGGVMNLVWVAAISALALAEKVLPGGNLSRQIAAFVLIAWGLATLAV